MRLPKNLLSPGTYAKPRIFLCETNKERICELDTANTSGSFKFNSYSELSFEVGRVYNDIITGETVINPHYDKIEALRLIEIENFGYFELQGPELVGDGIKESKSCKVYSYEYTLSQKYLEDFYVNTGEVNSIEVINASSEDNIVPVTLYNPTNPKLSLLHLILEKDYAGWKIGHIDPQLKTLSRQFEIDRESIYDFLMNEVCEKFNCYIVFDTIDNTINIYAESPTAKFIGDGAANTFSIPGDPFSTVQTVSIDGYKTTKWSYSIVNDVGTLVLEDTPIEGAMIEVVGVDSTWETDVFVTFDNLSQEINVSYDADSIKTVLTVTFGDDNDIREVNLGLPYIVDLSFYCTPEWMGQDLYDDWIAYQQKCNSKRAEYTKNTQDMLYYAGQIDYEENRLSLGYAEITVDENSVGKYYVRGGTYPNYYYTEVSLPSEFNANTTYYSTKTINLEDGSTGNVAHLYEALKKYFMNADGWKEDLDTLSEEFDFMGDDAITKLSTELAKVVDNRTFDSNVEDLLNNFFATMWNEIGRTPLKQLYYEPYKQVQITNMEAGWSQRDHNEYGNYYTVVLVLNSIEDAISQRDKIIKAHETEYKKFQSANEVISNDLLMVNNFTEGQRARLNAFLREDELHLDDIVTTSQDSIADTYKNQQDALESGRIELNKLCQPQLQFSMSMANIYALPEFEPIIDQFQLGKIIKVGIRSDYIKQSRLLQVDINFDDFSDFSCEFGELTSLRNQSDIHADLLKNAISAGKSVAQNASYWTKGSDQANDIDLRLQEGLLNSIDALKNIDGTQNAYIDKYGIHLEVVNPDTGEIGDKRVWMVNNQIVFTDDGFKTSKSVLGEFTVDGTTYYGLLAQAVIAGHIEGSTILGGTIRIGKQEDGTYAFEVHADGSVTMNGGSSIAGYAKEEDVNQKLQEVNTTIISNTPPLETKEGMLWLNTSPYQLMIFTDGNWQIFSQKDGETIYITKPESYNKGDLWIVNESDLYNSCRIVDDLTSILIEDLWQNNTTYYTKDGLKIKKIEYKAYESAEKGDLGNYTTGEDGLVDYHIYTSYDSSSLPDPAVIYHNGFFGSVGYNWQAPGDSITIYDVNNEILCSQSNIKYYGSDEVAQIAVNEDVELYLIYSNGEMYFVKKNMQNGFLCEQTNSKFVNGTLLKAIESSSTFSYDHWIDISPENTELQNNIYQNFTFNKETGLKIGQTDNKFYVNIDSKKMGFHSIDDKGNDVEVVHIGNNSATIQNATFEGSNGTTFNNNTTFKQQINIYKPNTTTGFTWKVEANGSLSLVVST